MADTSGVSISVTGNVLLNYRFDGIIRINFPNSFIQKILHVGLCIPASCTNNEILNISQNYFDHSRLQAQRLFEYQPHVLHVKELSVKTNFMEKTSVRIVGYKKLININFKKKSIAIKITFITFLAPVCCCLL